MMVKWQSGCTDIIVVFYGGSDECYDGGDSGNGGGSSVGSSCDSDLDSGGLGCELTLVVADSQSVSRYEG